MPYDEFMYKREEWVMVEKFKIKPDRKETENKTIRFPLPLIEQIEKAIEGEDATFSSFVIQACRYAIKNMDKEGND